MLHHVLRIFADTQQQSRLDCMQPVQADEVQTGIRCDSTLLDRVTVLSPSDLTQESPNSDYHKPTTYTSACHFNFDFLSTMRQNVVDRVAW
jgi:hypothetical protein